MSIEFIPLIEASKADIIELMNQPMVRKHMPLLEGNFDEGDYNSFIGAKQKIWDEHGYGPWAFILDGKFIGWGGLQPLDKDVEIALMLHPNYWGLGKALYEKMIDFAFEEKGLESVIILFPPSRTRIKALLKLGFQPEGKLSIGGHIFNRYRKLRKNKHPN